MRTIRSHRRLGAGLAVGVTLAGTALGGPTARAASADGSPGHYSGSEQVETGTRPPPAPSGFAGDPSTMPSIVARSTSFGRLAKAAGVGLRTYPYSPRYGNASTLDVYTPRDFLGRHGRTVRTVIFVHGGAWQKGDRVDLEPQAVQLARLGLVVVTVNYRLATEAPWPAQLHDVDDAVAFVREHARKLNVDNRRTVLIGSSAGGQIAANVATRGAGTKRFRGLVTLSGLVNPLLMADKDPAYSNSVIPGLLLRCLPLECPERYASATAASRLDARDMPSLMFHSKDEVPWNAKQSRDFVSVSRAAGVPARLVLLKGHRHGIDTWPKIYPVLRAWLLERLGTKNR